MYEINAIGAKPHVMKTSYGYYPPACGNPLFISITDTFIYNKL